MRLAFCFMSNNMKNMNSLYFNFKYNMNEPPYIIESYTKNVLINPPLFPDYQEEIPLWNTKWRSYNSSPAIDFFSMRQDSLEMAGNADVIFVGDDDFKFEEGSSEVINECCVYLEENPDCGAILLGANFGEEGKSHRDEIYITNKGHLNTNRGILVRNRLDIMDNRFHALGALEDSIISFTCLLDGYYIARRLHVPIEHVVERNTLRSDHHNINYDLDFIKNRGIWNKVTEILGEWEEQSIWPGMIWKEYRRACMVNGRIPKYTIEGCIEE
jgi:hypothetical protein